MYLPHVSSIANAFRFQEWMAGNPVCDASLMLTAFRRWVSAFDFHHGRLASLSALSRLLSCIPLDAHFRLRLILPESPAPCLLIQ